MTVGVQERSRRAAATRGAGTAPTFSERLSGRDNAFGLIRLILASLVIVSHAFPVGGWGRDPVGTWSGGQAELGDMAVLGFFAVSGFLIAKSAARVDLVQFLWRRALRILPAFYAVLVVTAFVVGPWFYARRHGSLEGYWTVGDGPFGYLLNNSALLMTQFGIHDLFPLITDEGGGGSVMNGSLWTLWFEWMCYLMAAALAVVGILTRRRWALPILTVAMFVLAAIAPALPLLGGFTGTRLTRFGSIFLVGAVLAVYGDRIRCDGRLAVLAAVALITTLIVGGFSPFGFVALGYLVLWAAAAAPRPLRRVGAVNDISYGVYVYAWPVQAGLAEYGVARLSLVPYILACMAVTAIPATLSWWLVERPSLSRKDWGPGKGWAERHAWFSGSRP